jgi:hypothetical protein
VADAPVLHTPYAAGCGARKCDAILFSRSKLLTLTNKLPVFPSVALEVILYARDGEQSLDRGADEEPASANSSTGRTLCEVSGQPEDWRWWRKCATPAGPAATPPRPRANAPSPPMSRTGRISSSSAGIRRVHGSEQTAKTALSPELLRRLVQRLPDTLSGRRDRALLLAGFAGALRRSELVVLELQDLSFESEGVVLAIRGSKTDPEAAGQLVGIPYSEQPETCPVRALQACWKPPVLRRVRCSGPSSAGPASSSRARSRTGVWPPCSKASSARWARPEELCGTLPAQRFSYGRGGWWSVRTRHHGPDPALPYTGRPTYRWPQTRHLYLPGSAILAI